MTHGRRTSRWRYLLAALPVVASVVPFDSAGADEHAPELSVGSAELTESLHCPTAFAHPDRPVVFLVHGTSVTDEENWAWNYEVALPEDGFDVCTVLLPNRALDDIQISSEYVVYGIREIARRSGRKVSVIGVSQGSLQPRWAMKWWTDTQPLVEDYISMAGTNHGAIYGDTACATGCVPAVRQQAAGSQFLRALNADDETPGPASYTSVYSLTDPIVQPSVLPDATAALDGATNIAVQDLCPGRPVDHIQSVWDAAYYAIVLDALSHPGPARLDRVDRSVCLDLAMPGVDTVDALVKTAETYVLAARVQSEYRHVTVEPKLACYATAPGCLRPVPPPTLPRPQAPPTITDSAPSPASTSATLPASGGDASWAQVASLACAAWVLVGRLLGRLEECDH